MTEEFQGMEPVVENEKDVLVARAKDMGIKNPHTMSVDTLKAKIAEKTSPAKESTKALSANQIRAKKAKEARKLVRVALRNMNPEKSHKTHELLKVSNAVVGTIHRAVPTLTDEEGTHVEQMLLNTMRDQQYLRKSRTKDKRTGETITTTGWSKEWLITELPPLTKEQLEKLAKEQALRNQASQ